MRAAGEAAAAAAGLSLQGRAAFSRLVVRDRRLLSATSGLLRSSFVDAERSRNKTLFALSEWPDEPASFEHL